MGSLMAGWDSHVPDPNLGRNKSFTKEEIEAFWKSKKLKEEEHLKDISPLSPRTQKQLLDMEDDKSLEKLLQKNGWWISSNSAFLNEPPVIAPEGTGDKYVPQFHVADMAAGSSTHQDRTGIGAKPL